MASGGPADPQSWNRYSYVQNDPVNFTDPNGLQRARACGAYLNWDSSDGFWIATGWTFWCYEGEFGGGGGHFTPPESGGGGSGKPSPVDPALRPLPSLGGEVTKKQAKRFNEAIKEADTFLDKKKDCAKLFGDNPEGVLRSTTFTLDAVFKDNSADFDTDSVAVTPLKDGIPIGTVTINMGSMLFFQKSPTSALSDNDYRAFALLHELGHLTGKLGDDRGDQSSPANPAYSFNLNILDNCFGVKP